MSEEAPTIMESSSFSKYVTHRKKGTYGGDEGARYAYAADLAMLATFKRIKPVEMAAAATVRMYKDVLKNQFLGTTIRVSARQFPSIHKIAEECAEVLSVPVPTVYITNSPVLNAFTFGTDDDAMIVIHSALVDHYEREELKFVIGHETGHIQNKHVIYGTVLQILHQTVGLVLRWIAPPIEVALQSWYRRAEITCDRAGLLCCGDPEAGARALLKLACGSQKLYGELNVDEYLNQLEEGRKGVGRFAELFASHPYLTKRIQALRVFGESEMYRHAAGVGEGGLSMEEVDRRTSDIIQVMRSQPRAEIGSGSGSGSGGTVGKSEKNEEGSRGD